MDGSAWPWSHDGSPIDFFEESQRPFQASAWKRRREEVEKSAAAGGAPPKKFSKLDLTAVRRRERKLRRLDDRVGRARPPHSYPQLRGATVCVLVVVIPPVSSLSVF